MLGIPGKNVALILSTRTVVENLANDCEIKSLNPTGGQHKEKNGDK